MAVAVEGVVDRSNDGARLTRHRVDHRVRDARHQRRGRGGHLYAVLVLAMAGAVAEEEVGVVVAVGIDYNHNNIHI